MSISYGGRAVSHPWIVIIGIDNFVDRSFLFGMDGVTNYDKGDRRFLTSDYHYNK